MDKIRMRELIAATVVRRINPAESKIPNPLSCRGFTLIEMVMVIVITGIIGAMAAVFIKWPVQQYLDVARRAELTDMADTAFYRLTGDISTAVPNSMRVPCANLSCIEFLPAKDVGRYRAYHDLIGAAAGDILDFSVADGTFDIIGPPIVFAAGDYIVVGNTQSDGAPAYDTASGVLRAYTGAAGAQSNVAITAVKFPAYAQLATQRFDVVDGAQQAVTYACEGTLGALSASGDGQAKLVKHWRYWNAADAVHASYSTGGSSAILTDKVSACVMDYTAINQRMGLLGVRLTLTSGGESVSLYQEIHVSNVP